MCNVFSGLKFFMGNLLKIIELRHEFSIDEYHYVEDSTNDGNNIHVGSVAGGGQIDVQEQVEAISASVEEINSTSPMHFKRVHVKTTEMSLPL